MSDIVRGQERRKDKCHTAGLRVGELMRTDRIGRSTGPADNIPPAEAFRVLDDQRIDIDRRMATLARNDPARDESWQALEKVLKALEAAVRDLANAPAADFFELRSKASILATLLRAEVDGEGQVIAEAPRVALTLSVADDVVRLAGG